jgi:hypothetical protein
VKLLYEVWDEYNLSFLSKENKNKSLSIRQKNDIILKAQQIISLHKNGFMIENSCYNDDLEVVNECKYIAKYGDISSVRRAIKFVNNHYNLTIKPKLSQDIHDKLQHKEQIRLNSIKTISVKSGKYQISFD